MNECEPLVGGAASCRTLMEIIDTDPRLTELATATADLPAVGHVPLRVTKYPTSILSYPKMLPSSEYHLPYRYCHLPY